MINSRILLAEDEKAIGEMVQFNLEEEGYTVVWEKRGLATLRTFETERFDLVILDIMLPELDGFSIFEKIRLKNNLVPILFLTARNLQEDKLKGLGLGADDYITKPFDLSEFLLRVKNLLKRSQISDVETEEYSFLNNHFNFRKLTGSNGKDNFELSAKEAMLLKLLLDHKNEVVTRDYILERVWGVDVYPSTRTVDNFIVKLRKCFEKDPENPTLILSIRGMGYKMVV